MLFKDKLVLITGAVRGIGKAMALEFAKEGATVIGVDYSEDYANQITSYLAEHGFKGQGFVMDVSKAESMDKTFAEISNKFGAVNILVNNAGITRDNLMLRMSNEEWEQVINTNLNSVFRLSRLCIRDMVKARWGRIISITSVVAFTGNPGQANYSASKAGMIAFSKSLGQEIASRGITVNCIAPGFIETDMTKKLNDAQREAIFSKVPMKRIGAPEDIAKAAIFLASDCAAYITGETIHVNGGMF